MCVCVYLALTQHWLRSVFWMTHLGWFTDCELLQKATVGHWVPVAITWPQLLRPERSQTVELMEEHMDPVRVCALL